MAGYLNTLKIYNNFLENHKHTTPKLPKLSYTIKFHKCYCILHLPCHDIMVSNDHNAYENMHILSSNAIYN